MSNDYRVDMLSVLAKKQKFIEEEIEIPEGVEITVPSLNTVEVKGPLGELKKKFVNAGVELSKQNRSLRVRVYGKGRRAISMLGTVKSAIRNMLIGVSEGYTYKLKIIATHFPMNVKIQDGFIIIENFVGEKVPRRVRIAHGVKATVKGGDLILSGIDKEAVSLTAGMVEQVTRLKGRDPRKFLDGIYIYEKKRGIE